MTRRESKRRKKFPSIFTGEGSRPTKQTMIVFLSRQRNLVFALFSRVPWGRQGNWWPGKQSPGCIGTRIENRSIPHFYLFQPWNPSHAIPSSHGTLDSVHYGSIFLSSRKNFSHCSRLVLSLFLFSPPFSSSFSPLPFISFFHPLFPFSFFKRWTRHRLRLACDR